MTDPFKDFLEELERRRSGRDASTAEGDNLSDDDGTPPPTRPRARRPSSGSGGGGVRPRLSIRSLLFPALIALFFVGSPIISLLTDARWFESLGAGALFWQRLQIQGTLFVSAALVSLLFLLATLFVAGLVSRRQGGGSADARGESSEAPRPRPPLVDERGQIRIDGLDRKSTRLNSSHMSESRMPSSA